MRHPLRIGCRWYIHKSRRKAQDLLGKFLRVEVRMALGIAFEGYCMLCVNIHADHELDMFRWDFATYV